MPSPSPTPARICRGCWDQMHMPIPIRGPLAIPLRIVGITQSKMNPNICTVCERSFRFVQKRRRITANVTMLFADMRGFTSLSEEIDPVALSEIVSAFQDRCAEAIWAEDGIVNKQMGDGLMAIFNFPIKTERHAEAAIKAAVALQRNCASLFADLAQRVGGVLEKAPGAGVGVHSGEVEIGEFSNFRSDFTAIGGAVNLTARLEAKAAAGEILISPAAAAAAADLVTGSATRVLTLKGIEHPVTAHVLDVTS
jgi:adenylate cyclase